MIGKLKVTSSVPDTLSGLVDVVSFYPGPLKAVRLVVNDDIPYVVPADRIYVNGDKWEVAAVIYWLVSTLAKPHAVLHLTKKGKVRRADLTFDPKG